MTDATNQTNQDDEFAPPKIEIDPATERQMLFDKAKLMGLTFSGNIGNDTLRQKIRDHLEKEDEKPEGIETNAFEAMSAGERAKLTVASRAKDEEEVARKIPFREKCRLDAMRLVRCRINNLDPKKQDLPGEIITVGNEYIGTVRKYVPFGEQTDNGYHIPHVIYEVLKSREYLNVKVIRGANGHEQVISRYVKEFAIELLDPLTPEELAQLGQAQMAAGSIEAQQLN